eukprot:1142355-Pelagomonas_calceolata.AAC.6
MGLCCSAPRLAEKIRTARVNKERAEQLRDNAQLKAQQQEYDTTFNLYVQRSEAAAAAQVGRFPTSTLYNTLLSSVSTSSSYLPTTPLECAQEAEALAKRKAMAIKAREVLEEQMAERQVRGCGSVCTGEVLEQLMQRAG